MEYRTRRLMYLPNGRKAEVVIIHDCNGNIIDWYSAEKDRKVHNVVVRDKMRKGV